MKFIRSKELGHAVDNEQSSSAKARNKHIITNIYRIQLNHIFNNVWLFLYWIYQLYV